MKTGDRLEGKPMRKMTGGMIFGLVAYLLFAFVSAMSGHELASLAFLSLAAWVAFFATS
jgi:hypothetical protein